MFTEAQLKKMTKAELIKLITKSPTTGKEAQKPLWYVTTYEDMDYLEDGALIEADTSEEALEGYLRDFYDSYEYDDDETIYITSFGVTEAFGRTTKWFKRD